MCVCVCVCPNVRTHQAWPYTLKPSAANPPTHPYCFEAACCTVRGRGERRGVRREIGSARERRGFTATSVGVTFLGSGFIVVYRFRV